MSLINPIHSLSFVLISFYWQSLQQEVFNNQIPRYSSRLRKKLQHQKGHFQRESDLGLLLCTNLRCCCLSQQRPGMHSEPELRLVHGLVYVPPLPPHPPTLIYYD